MLKTIGVCQKCADTKFHASGVAKCRGSKTFFCTCCHETSTTFAEGLGVLCHECSERLGLCAMCGRSY